MIAILYGNSYGGRNKTHGQVEKSPRIDSFDEIQGWGCTFCGNELIDIFRSDKEYVAFTSSLPHGYDLQLSYSPNGYGGKQTFFLCPRCGGRHRYLYPTKSAFLCRKCARLNYKSQQETKDSMRDYRKGVEYAKTRLRDFDVVDMDGFSFPAYIPDHPKGMHNSTYKRRLVRFFRYRERYTARLLADLARIGERI